MMTRGAARSQLFLVLPSPASRRPRPEADGTRLRLISDKQRDVLEDAHLYSKPFDRAAEESAVDELRRALELAHAA